MPVVVTGASGGIGRVLVPRLIASGGEVRAVIRSRSAADPLREAGAKVAVCDLDDVPRLRAAVEGAHTVCHLVGGLNLPAGAYEVVNAESVRLVLEAAAEARVERFVLLSYPGASAAASNPYLRAKGIAEDLVRDGGIPHTIIRATHVYGPRQRWLDEMLRAATRRMAAVVVGPGSQRLAPVHVRDLVDVVAAADDRATPVDGTLGLQGPDEVTADHLADLLAGRRRRKVHLSPAAVARLSGLIGRPLSRAALEVLAADSVADAPDAAAALGVARTSLASGLAASVRSRADRGSTAPAES